MDAADDDQREAARWFPLMERFRFTKLRIPIRGEDAWLLVSRSKGQSTAKRQKNADIRGELRMLQTDDMTWDDVETVLNEQMVFLPVLVATPTLWTGIGFEPKTMVGGIRPLLSCWYKSVLEVQLYTAARVAAHHWLAIEVRN